MPQELPSNVKKHLGNIFILPVLLVIALTYLQVMKFYNKETQSKKLYRIGCGSLSFGFPLESFHVVVEFYQNHDHRPRDCTSFMGILYGGFRAEEKKVLLDVPCF
jgi:hypothetical protein